MAKVASLTASAALAPIVVVSLFGAAAATDYRCVRGDQSVRWVEVTVDDPVQKMRCEVVYWKDTEQPGVRSVLWRARSDAAYCTRKADELVVKLEGGGWSCTPVENATTEAARETAPPVVEAPPAKPKAEIADAARAATFEAARDEAKAEPAEREPPPVRAALAPQRVEPRRDARDAGETEDKSLGAVLEATIEQNLVRLNDGVEGRFSADIRGYGDLDGDGLEDGVVFFTYESERLKHARFVAAYLYDGESYALAASKPMAGSDDNNIQSADIDSIEDGVIWLRLSVLEPGDASCCPSGERQQRLALREGQLVEVTPSASPMPGRAEETLATKPSQQPVALAVPRGNDPGEAEERAKNTGDERAADARRRQAETETESPERAPQAAPRQPGRSLQAPPDQATPGAARLQVAGEASSVDDRPAADIRVFIHYVGHHQGDAALARQLADYLRRRGFIVADIRPVDFSIGRPSVRYFFVRDRAASQNLVKEVSRFFEETPSQAPDEASDFTHYVPKPRPGNVEVWLPVS